MADIQGHAVDWDEGSAPIGSGGFTLLAPGLYPFEVTKFERSRFNGSTKIGPCPMAKVTISVDGVDNETGAMATTSITVNFQLWDTVMWKVGQFFNSMNYPKDAEGKATVQWDTIYGKTGFVKIKHREYNGKFYNDVDEFVAPEDVVNVGPAQQVQSAGYQQQQPVQQAQPAVLQAQAQQSVGYNPQPTPPTQAYQAVNSSIQNAAYVQQPGTRAF